MFGPPFDDLIVGRSELKYIDIAEYLEMKMKDEDSPEDDIKGLAVLISCLGVFFWIGVDLASEKKARAYLVTFQKYEE